jgi:hypothetical protein
MRPRPDAGEHQQLRRLQRAGAQQHLAPAVQGFAPAAAQHSTRRRGASVQQDAQHLGAGAHFQIGAAAVRRQIGLAALQRCALALVTWYRPTPSMLWPLKSVLCG